MLDRTWTTELTVNDRVVLRADGNGNIVDEQDLVIGRVGNLSPKLPIHSRTFCVRLNENVVDEDLRKLGSVDGRVVRQEFGEVVAKTEGIFTREIGAAFLAFKHVPRDYDDPIIVYLESEPKRRWWDEQETENPGCFWVLFRILAKIVLLIMAVVLVVAFILNTLVIWAGMLLTAAIVTTVFVRPESAAESGPPIPFTDQQIADVSSHWGFVTGCLLGALIAHAGDNWSCAVAIGGVWIGIYAFHLSGLRGVEFLKKRLAHSPAGGSFPPRLREFLVRKSKMAFIGSGVLLVLAVLTTFRLGSSSQIQGTGASKTAVASPQVETQPRNLGPVPRTQQITPPRFEQPPAAVSQTESKPPKPDASPAQQLPVKPQAPPPVQSVTQPPSGGDLTKLSPFELKCARNEPYARHGYIFKSQDLTDFFKKRAWYKPTTHDETVIWKQLSQADKDMINRVKAEEARRKGHP